jgi:hypothetical protein
MAAATIALEKPMKKDRDRRRGRGSQRRSRSRALSGGPMLSFRTVSLALAISATSTFTLSAAAAEQKLTVELKDGSSIRGELVEKVPGKQLTLLLSTGEVRAIEWGSIARIEEPSASPPSQVSEPAGDGIAIHIDADDPRSTLQRRAGTSTVVVSTGRGTAVGQGEAWEDLCVAPCDRVVPKNQTVRIAGDGITPSGNFVLQRDAKLDVKTGSAGLRVGGFWLTGLGLTAAVLGGTFLALDARKTEFDSQGNMTKGEPMIDPGINYALLGGGVLAMAGGIAMIIASGTTVRDDSGTTVGTMRRSAFTF